MKANKKRKMALRMQTKAERNTKGYYGSPYYSRAWEERKNAIKMRIIKKIWNRQMKKLAMSMK